MGDENNQYRYQQQQQQQQQWAEDPRFDGGAGGGGWAINAGPPTPPPAVRSQQPQPQRQPQPRAESDTVLVFKDKGVCFFKNNIVERLDNEIGDIRSDVSDRQHQLLIELEDNIVGCEDALARLDECLGSLDVVLALGLVSRERSFVRPEVTPQRVLAVKACRHPLQVR